jgi:hypothetical protein
MPLRREVRLRHPIGSSKQRRWITTYWTCSALFVSCGFLAPSAHPKICSFGPSPSYEVRRYVEEALPLWQQANPDLDCPPDVGALSEYLDAGTDSILDRWGRPYAYTCVDGDDR